MNLCKPCMSPDKAICVNQGCWQWLEQWAPGQVIDSKQNWQFRHKLYKLYKMFWLLVNNASKLTKSNLQLRTHAISEALSFRYRSLFCSSKKNCSKCLELIFEAQGFRMLFSVSHKKDNRPSQGVPSTFRRDCFDWVSSAYFCKSLLLKPPLQERQKSRCFFLTFLVVGV